MSHTIKVSLNGMNIIVDPTRLYLKESPNNQEVIWEPATSEVEITNIVFQGSDPPISPKQGTGGKWDGSFNANAKLQVYKYIITLKGMTPLDPEIEYGPGGDIGGDY